MADNSNPQYVSKSDIDVLLASFEQKLTEQKDSLLKEFDVRENKIHSHYAKKNKQTEPEDNNDDTPSRGKSTKRELELERLVRESSESIKSFMEKDAQKDLEIAEGKKRELLLTHKNTFVDTLVKAGYDPKGIDSLYKLQQIDNNFVDDGKGGFNWKVNVNGIDVALPIDKAVTHFSKTEIAERFLPPKTNGGGTKPLDTPKPSSQSQETSRRLPKVDVDWTSVMNDQSHNTGGSGDGTTAPPFSTK